MLFGMFSAKLSHRFSSSAVICVCIALFLAGCGGQSGTTLPPNQAVAITVQPLSQTLPIGETATFTVTATGTAPLSYQWSENGVGIAGATGTSYTTPAVALGNGGSTSIGSFQVKVSNATSSVVSNDAALTAGPRSPKAGDLRYLLFQQVALPGLGQDGGEITNILAGGGGNSSSTWFDNAVGTPLGLGSGYDCGPGAEYVCGWGLNAYALPPPMSGLNMYYKGGDYPSFSSDLQSIVAPNVVLTSLDFEPLNGAYAVAWVQTAQTGGFDYKLEVVSPAQVPATASADGTASRVITAASFDATGNANLISYGWTGDTTTVYEIQTTVASPDNVASAASTLAGEGYVISAFGGNDTEGYILIGTRVKGDSLPRPIYGTSPTGVIPTTNPGTSPYFTTVVFLLEFDGHTIVNEQ